MKAGAFRLKPFPCPSCGQGVLIDVLDTSSEPWEVERVLVTDGKDLKTARTNRHESLNDRLLSRLYVLRRYVEHSMMLRITGVRPWLLEEIDDIIKEGE